jgi:hypothetical protein
MEAFDEDINAPLNNEKTESCNVCGVPVYEKGVCSSKVCREVDNEL